MWLVAGIAVVLAGGVVVVAAMAETDVRAAPSRVGTITPQELRTVRLPIVWRGYDPGHVDAMLARAASALEDALHYGSDAPAREGELPGFLAATFDEDDVDEDDEPPGQASGEELEDGRGDGTGGLDG